MVRLMAALTAFAVLAACATTDVDPLSADMRPSEETDEAGLWLRMDEAEDLLQQSAVVVRDPALNAYLDEVFCNVAGEAYCDDVRVYIVEQPYFNANMAPNGMMQVWTGLLLRAQNEAQLAFVLGHEFAHYRQRHSLEQWREINNVANASVLFSVGVAAAGVPNAAVLGNFTLAAQLYGYGRDKEREADAFGFDYFTGAGYDPDAAAGIWEYLIDETEASDSERKKRQIARASIFSTHPVTAERVETLRRFADDAETGRENEEAFAAAIAPFLNDWLADDLVLRDFGQHLYLIDHKIEAGENLGVLYFRRGEAYRLRREEGDFDRALDNYRKAVLFDDVPAQGWMALGDALQRRGENAEARAAYGKYLELMPDAPERAIIEAWLEEKE
nr:M48 family metallopeptidase [Aquisalinus flavus]